jgi:DNA processing protein
VLVESAADVLDNLPPTPAEPRSRRSGICEQAELSGLGMTPMPVEARRQVLDLLSPEPTLVDDLVRRCQLSPPVTVAVLLELELAGRVETLPGSRVVLLPDAID